jgi:hypothetical protein
MVVESDGPRTALDPGDFSLVDTSRRGSAEHSPGIIVKILFPRALLLMSQPDVDRLTATRISGDWGAGSLVSSLARQLPRHLDEHDAGEGARLGTAVIDLLAVALDSHLDGNEVERGTAQRAMLLRVHAHIEERLGDPGPSPAASPPHITSLFATSTSSSSHRRPPSPSRSGGVGSIEVERTCWIRRWPTDRWGRSRGDGDSGIQRTSVVYSGPPTASRRGGSG